GQPAAESGAYLERGWVIANHKLVSFHAAFISSVLSLPDTAEGKLETLKFMFASAETAISVAMLYLSWHVGIAIHEMGHYLTAAKLSALNKASQDSAKAIMDKKGSKGFLSKLGWYAKMFALTPWGKFEGVKKEGGNFSPNAPYNLAVAAAGPRWSSYLAIVTLPIAAIALSAGLIFGSETALYIGRFFLAPGVVGLLDRFIADPGKVKAFKKRELEAIEKSRRAAKAVKEGGLLAQLKEVRDKLINSRMQTITLADETKLSAPWQWRNCAMGGAHTEKEYPESNISMQEGMFIPLSAKTYEEAQEMTVALQTRLKQIIESAEGARVMGIGLEGGLAPYIEKEEMDRVPEQRMWRMMKQAILECGYRPGIDVAIALDPAASELENAYREKYEQPSSVGTYLFWRDKGEVVMSRDEILELYKTAIERDGVPIVSIEDGFGEKDHEGWKLLMKELGDKLLVIGDDLVTTNDAIIEECARKGLTNATLIKANQIGTLTETVLAMLTSWAYGAELVVSHRSKSPNDPFEAEISTAMNSVGLKAGGGANTERLQKYGRVVEILSLAEAGSRKITPKEKAEIKKTLKDLIFELTGRKDVDIRTEATESSISKLLMRMLAIEAFRGREEPTNAGIPTGAVTVMLDKTGIVRFSGGVPLGTSAGETEAIHYVDSIIQPGSMVEKYPDLFKKKEDETFRFAKGTKIADIEKKNDNELMDLWVKVQRYDGKGCMDAVQHIENILGKAFLGKRLADLGSLLEIDRELLRLEKEQNIAAGRLSEEASYEEQVHIMQRKGMLGMNAVLSMSLALGRAIAARDGKELWQLIREQAKETMAKFIVANTKGNGKDVEVLKAMDLAELREEFGKVAKEAINQGRDIYMLLRDQLPVYDVPEEVQVMRIFEDKKILAQLDALHQSEMAVLRRVFKVEGSLIYEIELREEEGEPYPYLKVREGSKRGLGKKYKSRAEGEEFVRASDHKGLTIIRNDIWVDFLNAEKRGPEFKGKHLVAIPDKAGSKITVVLGRFVEPTDPNEKLALFPENLGSMTRFASKAHDIEDPEVKAKIKQAFVSIPSQEFFERGRRYNFETYIEPALQKLKKKK
ncbi:hypothetical protein AMJ44_13760, partial [candidate division WOR-1 bacterium DG_54_3]